MWARRAKLGQEQVNLANVARLWAERRAGELLRDMPKHPGGRPTETSRDERPVSPTLADIGISKSESSRFQHLASIPADTYQAAVDRAAEEGIVSAAVGERRESR